jgi:hypothetical protein
MRIKKKERTNGATYTEDVNKSLRSYYESDNIVLDNRSFGSRHWGVLWELWEKARVVLVMDYRLGSGIYATRILVQ